MPKDYCPSILIDWYALYDSDGNPVDEQTAKAVLNSIGSVVIEPGRVPLDPDAVDSDTPYIVE